ncbi:hypothetical protein [Methanococcoides methylutens]|uniref:hypothetical protein n=1 Tax=Methanococcoides methylutens TaxID=2226 RepID=UPI00064EC6B5|nr:hypothetical protein [Methanococcoides methylutens]
MEDCLNVFQTGIIGFLHFVVIDIYLDNSRSLNFDEVPSFLYAVSGNIINLLILAVVEEIPESTELFVLQLEVFRLP